MASMWDILQLLAELQVDAEPDPHASHIAGYLPGSESRAASKLAQSSWVAKMWDILQILAHPGLF
jgi:hypothetical protein